MFQHPPHEANGNRCRSKHVWSCSCRRSGRSAAPAVVLDALCSGGLGCIGVLGVLVGMEPLARRSRRRRVRNHGLCPGLVRTTKTSAASCRWSQLTLLRSGLHSCFETWPCNYTQEILPCTRAAAVCTSCAGSARHLPRILTFACQELRLVQIAPPAAATWQAAQRAGAHSWAGLLGLRFTHNRVKTNSNATQRRNMRMWGLDSCILPLFRPRTSPPGITSKSANPWII